MQAVRADGVLLEEIGEPLENRVVALEVTGLADDLETRGRIRIEAGILDKGRDVAAVSAAALSGFVTGQYNPSCRPESLTKRCA